MFERHFARLRSFFGGNRPDRASILVPFLIISAGLGVMAWRSYELSVRMERGANTLAVQYAEYASEITARRVDASIRVELTRANEDWQQIERRDSNPDTNALREWLATNPWIVSAIYVPDHDPAAAVFASEGTESGGAPRLSREFFTSSGTVRYTFDPARLLAQVHAAIRQQPFIRISETADTLPIEQRADVTLVRSSQAGLKRYTDGFAFISPLSSPLSAYSVRAAVQTSYVGSGWENQRLVSLAVSLLALALLAIGATLAFRGLKKEAETMKLRAELIANVSHELRTPLAMIRLGAETLKRGAKLKENERLDIQDTILREVLHLSHLVENVLDVARMQNQSAKALAFTPVDPRELVSALIRDYESWIRSKGFSISVHADDDIGSQMWDREAVSRAVLNLIDNAVKYCRDEEKIIEVILGQTPQDVFIAVKDHGIGIDASDRSRIFDPYYRARFSDTQIRRGAGLGLTLVQQIVLSHGGRVELESQPGQGSTFRLLFPRAVPELAEPVSGLVQQSKPLPS